MSNVPALLRRLLHTAFFILAAASFARGQITGVNSTTTTPVIGSGHDYFHMLNETVNPANGSVSLRIEAPTPKGRRLTPMIGLAYDTNGVHITRDSPSGGAWTSNVGYVSKGGWSYIVPWVSFTGGSQTFNSPAPPVHLQLQHQLHAPRFFGWAA